jgi:hypothetical protein
VTKHTDALPANLIARLSTVEWLEPWVPLSIEIPEKTIGLANELRAELGPGHVLFAVGDRASAIAVRNDCDDVLFWLGEDHFAVVRLTWTKRSEPEPWPTTSFEGRLEDFVANKMATDHGNWLESIPPG